MLLTSPHLLVFTARPLRHFPSSTSIGKYVDGEEATYTTNSVLAATTIAAEVAGLTEVEVFKVDNKQPEQTQS